MLLALASGLLMTLYSALYRLVKKDIDNSTVLILRGVIQVFFLALLFVTSLKYFFNNFVGLKSNYSLIPVNSWNFWNYTFPTFKHFFDNENSLCCWICQCWIINYNHNLQCGFWISLFNSVRANSAKDEIFTFKTYQRLCQ